LQNLENTAAIERNFEFKYYTEPEEIPEEDILELVPDEDIQQ
jgi:hypothetical protein